MKNSKKAEAETAMKEADKLTTKTFFRWKCDWDSGAILYEKAANGFRVAKIYDSSKYCYQRLSLCQVQMDVYYLAAKNMEMAATMAKEAGETSESVKLLLESVKLYRTNGNSFQAADTMTKAAKMLENTDLDKCIQLLVDACELFELDDKDHFSGDTFKQTISMLIKHKKYSESIELMMLQNKVFVKLNQNHDLHKASLGIIVMHLSLDDVVGAKQKYTQFLEYPTFSHSQEGVTSSELIQAFEIQDGEAIKKISARQLFNFLDNSVAKIAKALGNNYNANSNVSTTTSTTHNTSNSNLGSNNNSNTPTVGDNYDDESNL